MVSDGGPGTPFWLPWKGPGLAWLEKVEIVVKTVIRNPMVSDGGSGTPFWLPWKTVMVSL